MALKSVMAAADGRVVSVVEIEFSFFRSHPLKIRMAIKLNVAIVFMESKVSGINDLGILRIFAP
jgi:hypothetical protein